MKKFYLLIIFSIVFAYVAKPQSFTISDDNGVLTHDTTIVAFGAPDAELIVQYLYITNTSTSPITVAVKKEEIEVLEGTMNTFCFNGLCFPPFIFQSPNPMTLDPGVTTDNEGFYGDYYPYGHQGSTKVRYTFFLENNENDSLSVTVDFITGFVGIESLLADNANFISRPYPNPASSMISFDLDLPQELRYASIVFRNLLGTEVSNIQLSKGVGTVRIPLDGLADGIYFYTLNVEGNYPVRSGKFIINR